MGRAKKAQARGVQVHVRFTKPEWDKIDQVSGEKNQAKAVRNLALMATESERADVQKWTALVHRIERADPSKLVDRIARIEQSMTDEIAAVKSTVLEVARMLHGRQGASSAPASAAPDSKGRSEELYKIVETIAKIMAIDVKLEGMAEVKKYPMVQIGPGYEVKGKMIEFIVAWLKFYCAGDEKLNNEVRRIFPGLYN